MTRIHSPAVRRILRSAGWTDGRRIDLGPWQAFPVSPFPAAQAVLTEFGGLHFGSTGPGIDCARSDVDLTPSWPNRRFTGYPDLERSIGQRLYPLGETHRANMELLIDESGRVYELQDDLHFVAPTFADALEIILLGKRRS
ncbi:MAG: hypothetical protein HMLKMBBP_02187 [Planctomycetes bacterium]|nr:hypothetical protein [Planctomycetota bacterium]